VSARTLIGGVGYHWYGDASFGIAAVAELARLDWPPGVDVEELDYGAFYVAQDLADADPPYERAILLAAVDRGREPGRLYRTRWDGVLPGVEEIHERMLEAGGGVVDLDHLLVIATHFEALPHDVVTLEIEPADLSGADALSAPARELLAEAVAWVRDAVLAPVGS
jgi:hydrogenase maturation protease